MTNKGTQTMQKIVIKKPWGVEIKDYKADDPIPAGVKFKIFDAKDTDKIDAYADSLDESADYQKKRFKEPAYMYNESAKKLNEEYYIKWGKKYFCNMNGDPAWGPIKDFAIPFKSREEADKYMDKMADRFPMFYYNYDVKVVKESKKVVDMKVIQEGRIAKGYENLDAEERAKHLLSHPSSKYMNDLKSENITERAIRKAVKEMLGKPDKRDPQFIIDVNEEGEAPAIANTTAEVANPDLPLKLKEEDVEDSYKYQTSVAGGMGTYAENAPSAKEYEDKVSLIKEHKSFRKFLKEATKVPYMLKNAKVGDTFHDGSDLGREYKITRVTPSKVYATCVKDPNTTAEYNKNHSDYAETDPQWAKLYTIKESVGQKLNISLVRKPQNMKEVEKAIRKGEAERVKAVVDKSYKLSENEYDKFVYNFMVHTTYLNGEGGVDPDGTVHVVEITAPARKTIYVDPEGYDYARYVGW